MTDPSLKLVLKLEQIIHRAGWDKPPRLYGIKRTADKLRLTTEMPVPWDGEPGAILEAVAGNMAEPTEWGDMLARGIALIDGFDGLLFAYEGWMSAEPASERDADDHRRLADIPGSKEVRGVLAADVRGRIFAVNRIRGEKPAVQEFDEVTGRAPWALVTMVKAVAAHLPDEAVDREALANLTLLTDDEVKAKARQARAGTEADR